MTFPFAAEFFPGAMSCGLKDEPVLAGDSTRSDVGLSLTVELGSTSFAAVAAGCSSARSTRCELTRCDRELRFGVTAILPVALLVLELLTAESTGTTSISGDAVTVSFVVVAAGTCTFEVALTAAASRCSSAFLSLRA